MLKRIFFLLFFVASQAFSAVFNQEEITVLRQQFFTNFLANGAIVASPSRHEPNYYYDWVRDSAIAMGLVENWYESTQLNQYKNLLFTYISWTETIQHQKDPNPGQDILGEPKFYVDGYPFDHAWGRPQNDGPALRALVLIRFAQQLLAHQETEYVQTHLYNGGMDPHTMGAIKMDLEYVAHHWQDANFDLWEEVYGHHFFTSIAQRKALLNGAALARRLNDNQAAAYYAKQADLITDQLKYHIDPTHNIIQASLPFHSGPQKTLELDSSVILAILINQQTEGLYSPQNNLVKNTVKALHQQFNLMFPINKNNPGAILFGRYPGDTYDGYNTNSVGNPWFILTATIAEYYFTLANNVAMNETNKTLIKGYLSTGDNYLRLIKKYAPEMHLSEQINLNTGIQQGAASLTWSYVAVLRAIDLREKIEKKLMDSAIN
ncbi:glycoside hydrolase family 15 protein [Legionella fallonii]|nr:glycoside hydrolase family 15 protein [Legionella fallonii]